MLEMRRIPPCPICGKPAEVHWRPFCSRRCADVDLGRWFAGVYRVPTDETPEMPEAEWTETPDAARRMARDHGPR